MNKTDPRERSSTEITCWTERPRRLRPPTLTQSRTWSTCCGATSGRDPSAFPSAAGAITVMRAGAPMNGSAGKPARRPPMAGPGDRALLLPTRLWRLIYSRTPVAGHNCLPNPQLLHLQLSRFSSPPQRRTGDDPWTFHGRPALTLAIARSANCARWLAFCICAPASPSPPTEPSPSTTATPHPLSDRPDCRPPPSAPRALLPDDGTEVCLVHQHDLPLFPEQPIPASQQCHVCQRLAPLPPLALSTPGNARRLISSIAPTVSLTAEFHHSPPSQLQTTGLDLAGQLPRRP